jgi:hypothetical protein
MPTAASGSDSPFWYSFDYANIHFVAFSIEQPFNVTDPQGKRKQCELADADDDQGSGC